DAPVDRLPLAYRQLLQVARALAFDCRTLALDEPTTSLTSGETSHLFHILDDLKRAGVTLIYVSHRLPEVFRVCDRITALRDGRYVATFQRDAVTSDDIVQAMVGRSIPAPPLPSDRKDSLGTRSPIQPTPAPAEALLRVDRLTRAGCFEDVSLSVAAGEIVAMF